MNELSQAFRYVKIRKPYYMNAVVIMPDHLHSTAWMQEVGQCGEQLPSIWTLPPDDGDYSTRWNMLKDHFSRKISTGERISKSRQKRRERGIWQRRFWAHLIEDQEYLNRHIDYIHWNPVKHGYVKKVADWPYSSFHQFLKHGIYSDDWGGNESYEIQGSE